MNSAMATLSRAGRFWAITGDALADLQSRVTRGAAAFSDASTPQQSQRGQTAILQLYGILTPKRTFFTGTAMNTFTSWLETAIYSPAVSKIILDIDSPGGSVYGIAEAAALIRRGRALKPIYAVANPMAASAAYWIASAATRFYATPSGDVGSIGVYALHENLAGALDQMGIEVSMISAGRYKTEGNPFEPLGDEARAEIQRGVDDTYQNFLSDVARGRGVSAATVRNTYGQGRMVETPRAKQIGMIDAVGELNQVIRGNDEYTRRRKSAANLLKDLESRMPPMNTWSIKSAHRLKAGGSL